MLVAAWYVARPQFALLQFRILILRSQLQQQVDIAVIMYSAVRISCRSAVFRIYSWSCGLQGEAGHSVLLRSDGTAVACGDNRLGQCNIPDLVEGVTYTHVDTGTDHTVLLASDGTAAACGWIYNRLCNVPALSGGVIYTQVATKR